MTITRHSKDAQTSCDARGCQVTRLTLISGMAGGNGQHATAHSGYPILDKWAVWMQAQGWSRATVRNRRILLAQLAEFADCPPERVDLDHLSRFFAETTVTPGSRSTYHASLNCWFRWLLDVGLRGDNPLDGIVRPRARKPAVLAATTRQLEHLLASRMHARTRAMILLAAYQGLRASEVAKFAGSDIDPWSSTLHVIGKGGVEAFLPLHPVIEQLAEHHGAGYWFPQWSPNRDSQAGGHILGGSVSSVVKTAMKRAGVPGSAHSLRHWYATELLRQGVDIRVIQQLMRHASLATTERYLHVDDAQRREGLLSLPDVTATRALLVA